MDRMPGIQPRTGYSSLDITQIPAERTDMEFLVPFTPMFAMLPLAVGGAWIVHAVLRHRERAMGASDDVASLRREVDAMQQAQLELQERLDVTERVLAQVRDSQRRLPGAE